MAFPNDLLHIRTAIAEEEQLLRSSRRALMDPIIILNHENLPVYMCLHASRHRMGIVPRHVATTSKGSVVKQIENSPPPSE